MWHGLEGVDEEIEYGLLDQAGIEWNHQRLVMLFETKLDALELGLGAEEIDQLLEQFIHVDRFAVQLDLAGEAQEIIERFAQATGLALDDVQAIDDALLAGFLGVEVFFQELEIQLNG